MLDTIKLLTGPRMRLPREYTLRYTTILPPRGRRGGAAMLDTIKLLIGPRMRLPRKPQQTGDVADIDDLQERVTTNLVSHIEELIENDEELVTRIAAFRENHAVESTTGNMRNLVTTSGPPEPELLSETPTPRDTSSPRDTPAPTTTRETSASTTTLVTLAPSTPLETPTPTKPRGTPALRTPRGYSTHRDLPSIFEHFLDQSDLLWDFAGPVMKCARDLDQSDLNNNDNSLCDHVGPVICCSSTQSVHYQFKEKVIADFSSKRQSKPKSTTSVTKSKRRQSELKVSTPTKAEPKRKSSVRSRSKPLTIASPPRCETPDDLPLSMLNRFSETRFKLPLPSFASTRNASNTVAGSSYSDDDDVTYKPPEVRDLYAAGASRDIYVESGTNSDKLAISNDKKSRVSDSQEESPGKRFKKCDPSKANLIKSSKRAS
ncbi:Uncharacterized protein OBRU01_08760 [Operophtera brumata]|uniref:Uncharacterized protein n=1 Tax=Operophtera brumata TaxID=104452 RepID=A0A0L7LGY4_OPEBR|nr:Uncharacterized protein OBRU01_08760 [Operophtera brumata]